MKKSLIALLGILALGSMGAELKLEKDSIRFAPYGKFVILPYHFGMITLHEEKVGSIASFYFDMETKHPKRYFSQGTKAVAPPSFRKKGEKEWIAQTRIPLNAKENTLLTMSIKMTPLNTLDIQYNWEAPKAPGDILSKGITLNYKTFHLKDPAITVSGKKILLPNKKGSGLLANNQESPDVILYPGTRMETKFALEGKYNIHYYTNKDRLTVIRIVATGNDRELRFTIVPR